MNSYELLPGGAVVLRNLIDEQTATETGRKLRAIIDSSGLPPIFMVYDVVNAGRSLNGFTDQDHGNITERVAELTGEKFNKNLLDIIAVYMRGPSSRFGFHADSAHDIRTIINISEEATGFSIVEPGVEKLKFDSEGWLRTDIDKLHPASYILNPGDAYVVNNLGSGYAHKLVHATPPNSQGRITLRYDQRFWSNKNDTHCRIVVPECVELKEVAEGFNLEPLPLRGG